MLVSNQKERFGILIFKPERFTWKVRATRSSSQPPFSFMADEDKLFKYANNTSTNNTDSSSPKQTT